MGGVYFCPGDLVREAMLGVFTFVQVTWLGRQCWECLLLSG